MRVTALMLGAAVISAIGLTAQAAGADTAKAACACNCPCGCPDVHQGGQRHGEYRSAPHRAVRHYAQGTHYSYRGSAPFHRPEWHGPWRVAPAGAYLPQPRRTVEPAGLVIDQGGWSGGVGYGEEGGGGGYGQVLLANGNSQNGPTYNSFGESFQQNPSMARPFLNRLMGGLAQKK